MITLICILALMAVWCVPGSVVARGLYSEKVREVRSKPVKKIDKNVPPRPKIKVNELLHDTRCACVKGTSKTCTCSSREKWVELRNQWLDYDDYLCNPHKYREEKNEDPSVSSVLYAVPLWPLALTIRFIVSGAKTIPDYREIERMEQDMKELG